MSSLYVCQTCRRELHRRLSRREWLPRRTFISFDEIIPPQQKEKATKSEHLNESNPESGSTQPKTEQSQDAGDVKEDQTRPNAAPLPVLGRYSRLRAGQQDIPSIVDSQTSFNNLRSLRASLTGLHSLSPLEAARLNPSPTEAEIAIEHPEPHTSMGPVEKEDGPAVKLWTVLSKDGHDAKEAWGMFEEFYLKPGRECDAIRRPSPRDKTIIREKRLFKELLRSVASQWEPGSETIPSPAEAVATLHGYGVMGQGWYLLEILEMLYRATRLRATSTQEEDSDERVIIEEQLLALWSQFMRNTPNQWIVEQHLSRIDEVPKGLVSWNRTPNPEGRFSFSKKLGNDAFRFPFRMHRLFDGVPTASAQHLAAAGLFTFDYFTHQYCGPYSVPDERVPYEPFVRLMLKVLHSAKDIELSVSLGLSLLRDNEIPDEEINKIATRIKKVRERAELAIAIEDLQVLGLEKIVFTEEQETRLIVYFYNRIRKQIRQKHRGVIDQLWEQAKLAYSSADTNDDRSSHLIPYKIYSAFLYGYRGLQEPERQAGVWNHMLASGMTPMEEHWGLMISARMKHLNSMEHIWDRMLASGTHPSIYTWSSRLNGHIYFGDPEDAIQLMYQWGYSWYDEIKNSFQKQNVDIPDMSRLHRDGPTVPRPNDATLSTVITALIQRKGGKGRRLDLVPDAFAWAETFGIKANVWTYNTLFRTCLKDGNLKEAMQLLSKMEEDGIAPDAYTFYGFADFIFRQANKSAVNEDEQYKLMFSILDLLEQRGLDPNAVFFGSMIDSLLKVGRDKPANIKAAMMLLQVMIDKNVEVTPAIWTSIMTYHFQEGRREDGPGVPDWVAMEALWQRMHKLDSLALDAFFYDRMIEGYASFGEVSRAMTLLDRMVMEGKRPGWSPLTAILSAYINLNLTDKARSLVNDVITNTGIFKDGVHTFRDTSRHLARERFFSVAHEADLLSGQEDLDAIKEYKVSDVPSVHMPIPVEEGYKFGAGQGMDGNDPFQTLDEYEKQFESHMDLMPSLDDFVERVDQRVRR